MAHSECLADLKFRLEAVSLGSMHHLGSCKSLELNLFNVFKYLECTQVDLLGKKTDNHNLYHTFDGVSILNLFHFFNCYVWYIPQCNVAFGISSQQEALRFSIPTCGYDFHSWRT